MNTTRETLEEVRRHDRVVSRLNELWRAKDSRDLLLEGVRGADQKIARLVRGLVRDGASWSVIGQAVGLSRSQAFRRYRQTVIGSRTVSGSGMSAVQRKARSAASK